MSVLNILSAGFTSPNGRAFLFPFYMFKNELHAHGITVNIFTRPTEALFECDYLGVDSKYYSKKWANSRQYILEEVRKYKERAGNFIFFDISDSSSWDQAYILPYVSVYAKGQLLKDKSHYLRPLYGNRVFTDYYHNQFHIIDDKEEMSVPLATKQDLSKLLLSWNSGLADYSWLGPYKMALYDKCPIQSLLTAPYNYKSRKELDSRMKNASLRIGVNYERATVAFQRKKMVLLLGESLDTNKLKRRRYLKELSDSKVAVSPFGLGEISLRDFEVFRAGALMLKADLSHMETWPNYYESDQTYIAHDWACDTFLEKLEYCISNITLLEHIAREGQKRYMHSLDPRIGGNAFCKHLEGILGAVQ